MEEFFIPLNHIAFKAKKLFGETGKINDVSIAYLEKDGGGPATMHTHSHDHLFIVTQGEAELLLGDAKRVVRKDEAFLVKGGIAHAVWNRSDGPTVMIGITVRND